MSRNTPEELKVIIPATSLVDPALQIYLDTADVLVTRLGTDNPGMFAENVLKNIELFLGAHYCTLSDPSLAVSREQFEGSSKSYQIGNISFSGNGLLGTKFGQSANTLSNGYLAEYDKTPSRVFVVG